jgi:trehalose-6-phosphatase
MKEISYQKFLDEDEYERLRIKIHSEKGKLIDIVVQYESFLNNKWHPIVRYDCSHGFFHRDVMKPNGEKEKQIISITNLKDALKIMQSRILRTDGSFIKNV